MILVRIPLARLKFQLEKQLLIDRILALSFGRSQKSNPVEPDGICSLQRCIVLCPQLPKCFELILALFQVLTSKNICNQSLKSFGTEFRTE